MTEDRILKAARELGEEIGKSTIWKEFRRESERFKHDKKIQELLQALREKEKLQSEKLEKGLAVEVEEKREIKMIEKELSENEIFTGFITCENRYLALMGNIDRAIKQGTDAMEKEEEGKTQRKRSDKEE
jgi:cell fate (sporulation/competence/biofilm development) regulator YlbF (YheA/YmcA/DUF963 family)